MRQFLKRTALAVATALILAGVVTAAPAELIVGGNTIGLQLRTRGVSVVEFSDSSAAKAAGLQKGDMILGINGREITSAEEVTEAVNQSGGGLLTLTVERKGKTFTRSLAPRQTAEGWRLGVYVRDSITGIGTVTYYDPQTGRFGALGHGVNDGSSATLLPLREGKAIPSRVVSVERGKKGDPGALRGAIESGTESGTIERNTVCGIFGRIEPPKNGKTLPVATDEAVHTGAATIYSNVNGTAVEEYTISIVEVYDETEQRNLLFEVTDPDLLAATGGIVQGMSGSPIIQDGKLIGAVTHVLVNDPTQGYGIFIENMLDAAA